MHPLFLKRILMAAIALSVLGLFAAGVFLAPHLERFFFRPTPTQFQVIERDKEEVASYISVVASDLSVPWEVVFLPEGGMLVTERSGSLVRIFDAGKEVLIEGVEHRGEGGLLGMTLHPKFSENRWLYLYFTTAVGEGLENRVERYRFADGRLSEKKQILSGIPGAKFHDGGRLAFGPDGFLYITTGDAGQEELAQDLASLAGKILRVTDEGAVPAENPFGTAVYSYGHRNPQGLAWDSVGRLWATEHGRSGAQSGFDELNLIDKGANYGWPVIEGEETAEGMRAPVIQSGADETWAPSGAAFLDGRIVFAGLRGESLYEAVLDPARDFDPNNSVVQGFGVHLRGAFGRLRAVVVGPDGYLYVTTSNTDGRGEVREGDDKLLRIDPKIFQ